MYRKTDWFLKGRPSRRNGIKSAMNDQQRRKKVHSVVPVNVGWQDLLTAAMLQRDPVRQRQFLYAAKAAIDDRLQELQLDHEGSPEERQAISEALSSLNLIRRELEKDGSSL